MNFSRRFVIGRGSPDVTYDGRGLLASAAVAEQYDLYRPSRTTGECVGAVLGDVRGLDVLEVGAGTGKWTRLLFGTRRERSRSLNRTTTCARYSCVVVPNVRAVKGAAEALPLRRRHVRRRPRLSAWHWFEQPAATNEMARVLRDDGHDSS
jgi:ubiquinone/menaquinone biosynthesis C-methylase UbiE